MAGFSCKVIGRAARGEFKATLAGLPVGGPFDITLSIVGKNAATISEELTVRDVLVGDVWVCAGQSNAEGCGLLADRAKPHPMTRAFYMNDRWGVAKDPVNCLADAIDQVHRDLNAGELRSPNTLTGTGFSVAFGQEMYRVTGVPQGVIACAHGGTSMAQWDPDKKSEGSKSLYGATVRRVCKNGSQIAGVLWYQGESDCDPCNAAHYIDRMKKLVASLRRDFRNPRLPFACVQLARVVGSGDTIAWETIRDGQRHLANLIKYCTTVPAIDLSLDDGIHISGRSQQILGRRIAQAMLSLDGHTKAACPPIAVKRISLDPCPPRGTRIIVEFDHVMGKLEAAGRPLGFALLDRNRNQLVFRTELDGFRAVVHTSRQSSDFNDLAFFYGAGVDPVCNITDSGGRSLPAFGPVQLAESRAVTPFPSTMEVSALAPLGCSIQALDYPSGLKSLQFERRAFQDRFTHIHPEFAARAPEDLLVYFRCFVECSEAMRLDALLGYDGPVKLWIDGREYFSDADGYNPAIIDHQRIPLAVTAGRHEILVALGSNFGRAWGIFLRFERRDVPLRLIHKGPNAYTLPLVC